jgi:precorrin-6A/cobalt-precorrin-6A reductase
VTRRVLILAGTAEARAVAGALDQAGVHVISSLAGRVTRPRLPAGDVRVGGFGGPVGLSRWLDDNAIVAVIDATHPFAERISASAARATAAAGIPLVRLDRPGWQAAEADRWHWVDDLPAAAAAIRRLGATRVLLTTGRQGLAAFAADRRSWFLIRCVDPPTVALPASHEVLLARGPFTLAGELALIDAHEIDLVVTKDSGGPLTEAKLHAARARGLPVVVVRRPHRGSAPSVADVAAAVDWAMRLASPAASPGGRLPEGRSAAGGDQ